MILCIKWANFISPRRQGVTKWGENKSEFKKKLNWHKHTTGVAPSSDPSIRSGLDLKRKIHFNEFPRNMIYRISIRRGQAHRLHVVVESYGFTELQKPKLENSKISTDFFLIIELLLTDHIQSRYNRKFWSTLLEIITSIIVMSS